MTRVLWLGGWAASRNYLNVAYGIDGLRFATTLWYDDVDFDALRAGHGRESVERLAFHVAAFEANKLCSLRPDVFDPGPFARHCTEAFEALWTTVAHRVWAEWRYRHAAPELKPPRMRRLSPARPQPACAPAGDVRSLLFCGGGKDSLVMARLLEAAGEPCASLGYAHSVYGDLEHQHGLLGGMLAHTTVARRHRMWVLDDVSASPVAGLRPEFGSSAVLAAETPAAVFGALPLALAHGYERMLVGHERSADVGNLVWQATGEEVNHQWGKSLEAERLLAAYVREHLVENVTYASPLKPVNDTVIFSMLDPRDPALPHAHSCNERKPWCERCAKCAYVWLGYHAHLPPATADAVFGGRNLLDEEANQLWFRQMLGLEAHTPFECVGGVDEARLCFDLCRRAGLQGRAMDAYTQAGAPAPGPARIDELCAADLDNHALPADLHARLAPLLQAAAERARRRLSGAASPEVAGEIRAWNAPRRSATAARPHG